MTSTTPSAGDGRTVLLTGASGFIGRRLGAALVAQGYDVRAMTRRPDDYDGPGKPVLADALEPATLPAALEGCSAAYYLIHSLSSSDFARLDAEAARAFGEAAAEAGLEQIVYLGGLGDDSPELSEHLRSRRQSRDCSRVVACQSRSCAPGSSSATRACPGRSPGSWSSTFRR